MSFYTSKYTIYALVWSSLRSTWNELSTWKISYYGQLNMISERLGSGLEDRERVINE